MMPTSGKSQRFKAALIPVLGLLLAAVLFWPSEDTPGENATTVLPESTRREKQLPGSVAQRTSPRWPKADATSASSFDPFRPWNRDRHHGQQVSTPESASEDDVSSEASKTHLIANSKPRLAAAVIERDGQAFVYIDGEYATIGQTLQGGGKILSITSDGVIVRSR